MNLDSPQQPLDHYRNSVSTQDSVSHTLKSKFRSVISRASRNSNASSLNPSSFAETPRGSFQAIATTTQDQNLYTNQDSQLLMDTTGSSGSSGDDEELSGENSVPDQLMGSKDDLEYYRNFYKQQQEQSPRRRKSRMLEDLDPIKDSVNSNPLPSLPNITSSNSNQPIVSSNLQNESFQMTDSYSLLHDSTDSADTNKNILEKSISGTSSNIESMVTAPTHQNRYSSDDFHDDNLQYPYEDEEIERLKNNNNNNSNIIENSSTLINKGKRNILQSSMNTTSTTTTSTTNESFHSAIASLGDDHDSTQVHDNSTSFNNSEKFAKFIAKPNSSVGAAGISSSSNNSLKSSDNEADVTINNNNSSSSLEQSSNTNLPTPKHEQFVDRSSSIYNPQSNRTSIAMSINNRNTKTHSFYENNLDTDHHPLPDITKYEDTFNFNINDMDDDDDENNNNTDIDKRVNESSTDIQHFKSMDDSENAIADSKRNSEVIDDNHDSLKKFYYESEEPVILTLPDDNSDEPIHSPTHKFVNVVDRPQSYTSDSSSRKSKSYSEAQTKFPLLSMIGLQAQTLSTPVPGFLPVAFPPTAPGSTSARSSSTWGKRTTTFSMNSSNNNNNIGANRYSYQTNITEPNVVLSTVTYNKDQPTITSPPIPYFDNDNIQKQQNYQNQGYALEEDEDVQLPKSTKSDSSSFQRQNSLREQQNNVSSAEMMVMPPYLNNSGSVNDKLNVSYKISNNSAASQSNTINASSAIYAAAASVVPSTSVAADKIKDPTIKSTTDGVDYVQPSQFNDPENVSNSFRTVLQQQHELQQRFDNMGDMPQHNQRYSSNYQISRHSTKFKARPFHLKPGNSDLRNSPPHRVVSAANSVTSPLMNDMFDNEEKIGTDGAPASNFICPESTIWALLMIAFFVPPLYLVICFGFLDHNVGHISRKYKMIACFMSMLMLVGSIAGICIGLGVGLTLLT